MKNSQLNRVLQLVRHTGDRMVVLDPETDDVMVMMRLPEYEDLIGSKETEPTLGENLNRFSPKEKYEKDWSGLANFTTEEDEDMDSDFGEETRLVTRPRSKEDSFTPISEIKNLKNEYPWDEYEKKSSRATKKPTDSLSAFKSPDDSLNDALNFDDYDWNKEEGVSLNEEDLRDIPEEEEEEKFYLEPVE
jgi:hypothetical protein